jgi:integrase
MNEHIPNIKSLTRKNGRTYTLKEDKNRFFYPAEYQKAHDCMKKKQQHTATCLINTGARINEARHIEYTDIDLVNNRLTLRITKSKAKKGESKGRVRIIPISSQFSRYLKQYFSKVGQDKKLGILSTSAFDTAIKKAAKKAGINNPNDFSAHSLRKTIETWLLSLNVDSGKILAHLGHDIRTAMQHYVSPDIFTYEEKKQMREIIGDLYETNKAIWKNLWR